jgi:hypothetical protein
MSINPSGSGEVEYADHEVQVITNQLIADGTGADQPAESAAFLDQLEPVSNRGLDSDELAELVAIYRHDFIDIDRQQLEDQTELGELTGESAIGINLSQEEVPLQANVNNATSSDRRIIENDNNIAIVNRGANYSEPGTLDYAKQGLMAAVGDDVEGEVAPGVGANDTERFINFRDEFGSGPYVDRTDDITVFGELGLTNVTAIATLETTYTLYWQVEEMPQGRASFARP